MKKAVIVFIVAAMVLVTTGIWFFNSANRFRILDIVSFGIIVVLIGFAAFIGFKKLTSARRGEPAEDELSKKVMQKTAAWSYYVSLYMWVGMIFISDKITLKMDELLGAGILAMALTFAVFWLIFHFKGVENE